MKDQEDNDRIRKRGPSFRGTVKEEVRKKSCCRPKKQRAHENYCEQQADGAMHGWPMANVPNERLGQQRSG